MFHVHFHVIPRYGKTNPFHSSSRERLVESDAGELVRELSRP